MSQFIPSPDEVEVNEAIGSQQTDAPYNPDDEEGAYQVVLRVETKANPTKILDDLLVEVKEANDIFHSALSCMLAAHTALEHIRICFNELDEDDYPSLVAAAKSQSKFHAYILRGDNHKAVDKTRTLFMSVQPHLHPPTATLIRSPHRAPSTATLTRPPLCPSTSSKCNTAMKLILQNPDIFGVLALSDIAPLAKGFEKLQLTSFNAALRKVKSAAQIAKEEEDTANAKMVGRNVVFTSYSTAALNTHTHHRRARRRRRPHRRRTRLRPTPMH